MNLLTTARQANGLMALTNGTSRSHPLSHSPGDIVVNMNPDDNFKKMDTVVKLDAVSLSTMAFKL